MELGSTRSYGHPLRTFRTRKYNHVPSHTCFSTSIHQHLRSEDTLQNTDSKLVQNIICACLVRWTQKGRRYHHNITTESSECMFGPLKYLFTTCLQYDRWINLVDISGKMRETYSLVGVVFLIKRK